MRSREQSTAPPIPPPWTEGESIRETTLHLFKPKDRRALRRVGRFLFDAVIVESDLGLDIEASITRAELRAAAADLRYAGGYMLHIIRQSAEDSDLEPEDDRLARFAGRLGRKVLALAEKIEERLGAPQPAAKPVKG